MQQEEGCGGEQQYLEHDALEERAELVRVEQDRAARDVVEGDELDRAVVAAVIGIGHAADGIAGLDGSGDLLGDVGLELEILYVKLPGQQGNEIVLGGEDDLIGVGRELDLGVGDFLTLPGEGLGGEVLKAPLAQALGIGEAGGDGRVFLRAARAAEHDREQLRVAVFGVADEAVACLRGMAGLDAEAVCVAPRLERAEDQLVGGEDDALLVQIGLCHAVLHGAHDVAEGRVLHGFLRD